MSPLGLLKRVFQGMADRFVYFFDVLKRREMTKKYRKPDPFGRLPFTGDIDAAVSLLPNVRYSVCLEVGTGLGLYAERVAPLCDRVIAIDICRSAIRRARKRLHEVPNIVFQTRNIRRLTGASGRFDLIILGDVLYNLGDLEFPDRFQEVVDRIVSFLAPGGRILVSHHISPDRQESDILAYTMAFERRGLTVERSHRFNNGLIDVVQAVLRAPQPRRSSDIPR